MTHLLRHARGAAVALVVLAVSAGIAFAGGMPDAATFGLSTAGAASGQVVPANEADQQPAVDAPDEATDPTEGADPEEMADPEKVAELVETPDENTEDAPDPSDPHGDLVAQAAAMETPDGFRNHGEFVSCVARMNQGHDDGTATDPIDPATLTPADCTRPGKGNDPEFRASKAQARADRQAAKAERTAARAAAHGGS